MPNRWIRESCRTSKNLAQVSDRAERLFWRLTTCADDFGRFLADPEVVRAQCFAYRPKYLISYVQCDLRELVIHRLVRLYVVKDRQYGHFCTWEDHQGKPRAMRSKYPDIPTESQILHTNVLNGSQLHTDVPVPPKTETKTRESLSSLSSLNPEGEKILKKRGATAFPDEWKLEPEKAEGWRKFGIDPFIEFATFRDHARTNDRRCHDWEAAWRNWARKAIKLKEQSYVQPVR